MQEQLYAKHMVYRASALVIAPFERIFKFTKCWAFSCFACPFSFTCGVASLYFIDTVFFN